MYINKKMLSMLFIILLTFIAKPTLSEELKIGLVNLGVILKEIPMWRESQAKIKKQFDPRQRELKTMETELTSLNNKYLKNEKIMAKDEKESLIKQIQKSEYLKDHGMVDLVTNREDLKKNLSLIINHLDNK